ncbi:MAG: DNA mismatch repair protein MutS [SAR324 cluster bacterium]|nr:DNA mismatch repair protein MutS [SAR324 cluster bacterium]
MGLVKANTPMMKQFNAIKGAYPDCIIFFRAGDFYEMFGDDAVRASEILNIALTTRNKDSANAVAMCGVPYHAYEQYLNRLTAAGLKVAICEQMEDAAQAKALVRREVVRVVTPGTTLSAQLIEDDRAHYLVAIELRPAGKPVGLALADLSTGQFEVLEFAREDSGSLWAFLLREQPREILLPEPRNEKEGESLEVFRAELVERLRVVSDAGCALEEVPSSWFEPAAATRRLNGHFNTTNLAGFGVEGLDTALRAAGALLAYLDNTQKCDMAHITQLRQRRTDTVMWLDEATLTNLELFDNPAPGAKRHTLFAVLNHSATPMGARLLRRWLGQPLLDGEAIEARLAAVGELLAKPMETNRLRKIFSAVRDLERTVGRISLPVAGIADVLTLRESLGALQDLPEALEGWEAQLLAEVAENFDPMSEVHRYLSERILPEPSLKLTEGGYIASGVSAELDELRELTRDSRQVISALEAREREATGISSLKIRFNRVFGYYLEISKVHQDKIPATYVRKQTLVNAERYTTLELGEIEEKILGAEERIGALEYGAFQELRSVLAGYARRMQAAAEQIALMDALGALAHAARENNYTRPTILPADAPRRILIESGRHPVLERIDLDEPFIPNNLELDGETQQIVIITGPNMAGKSTVMRQVALIQLMAQIGAFVPAQRAELSLVDRIFTRVGASDNLSRGQSTFMMEMNEAANILNNATPHSLIVLDEIGRGTSTYDGISIAWAMVEHLHQLGAMTLFATHYHELTQLARELPRLKNFHISIEEEGERLVFPRKLTRGEADKSYGIQVARLAGLPSAVVERAHAVMDDLTAASDGTVVLTPSRERIGGQASPQEAARVRQQLSFLSDAHPTLEEIRALELDGITPREALQFLYRVRARLDEGKDN